MDRFRAARGERRVGRERATRPPRRRPLAVAGAGACWWVSPARTPIGLFGAGLCLVALRRRKSRAGSRWPRFGGRYPSGPGERSRRSTGPRLHADGRPPKSLRGDLTPGPDAAGLRLHAQPCSEAEHVDDPPGGRRRARWPGSRGRGARRRSRRSGRARRCCGGSRGRRGRPRSSCRGAEGGRRGARGLLPRPGPAPPRARRASTGPVRSGLDAEARFRGASSTLPTATGNLRGRPRDQGRA